MAWKIRDRIVLGVLAGLAGNVAKTLVDEASMRMKISQRSFRSTAAGVWVSTKGQTDSVRGQILGGLLDTGMATGGGLGLTAILTRTGRDHYLIKGLVFGTMYGSVVSAILSGLLTNKLRPKDAASNLSYLLSHVAFGLVAGLVVSGLGHPSLFDVKPTDYLPPTEKTSEQMIQKRLAKAGNPLRRRRSI